MLFHITHVHSPELCTRDEGGSADDVHTFLRPGFKRCTSTITPVSEVPVPRP